MNRTLGAAAVILLANAVFAQPPETAPAETTPPPKPPSSVRSKLFFGGGLGLSFGTIDYVSIAPMVGYHVVPRFDVALQPFYSYTKDSRYEPEFTASNYGADLLARYRVFRNFFVEGRYEWISYEYFDAGGNTQRRSDSYPFAGVGYTMGAGRVGAFVSALYNFGYDDDDPFRPYDSPWMLQVGVAVGF